MMSLLSPETWNESLFSDGWRRMQHTAPVVEPATGAELGRQAISSADDVDASVARAVVAQRAWAAQPAVERSAVLRRAGELIEAHADEYASLLVREAGSAHGKAGFEVGLVAAEFQLAAATALEPFGELLRSAKPRLSLTRRIPVGVVGVISPFNFPGILTARSLAPALALGNAVVLKPDPRTTLSGGLFFAALLEDAGLPAGLLHVLPGGAEIGMALVDHPGIPLISFTGSTRAGQVIGERAGRLLKRVHLELGGNNAFIVLPGADVDAAASAGAWGSFLHQGQICMTSGRHLVHESVHDRYVEALAAKAARLHAGHPDDGAPLGPLIDDGQRDRVHRLVLDSVAAGARLVVGGTYDERFYQPTVLVDVQVDHPAFSEEVFGPVAPVMAYSSVDELVEIVTSSPYGLSLGIVGPDAMEALEIADRLPSGIVHINDQTVDDEAVAPFGGVGMSGTGARFGGHSANLDAFTETQWVTLQREIERYPF